MKPNIIDVLIIAVLEATLTKLEQDNAQLREHCSSHDRLRTAHENVKARNAVLEEQVSTLNRSLEWNYQERQVLEKEVHQLKQQLRDLNRKNIDLAAEAKSAQQIEQQLATADQRIRELESALAVASLPAASRANVIAMIQEAA